MMESVDDFVRGVCRMKEYANSNLKRIAFPVASIEDDVGDGCLLLFST
jgi:hypothetical protein